MATKQVFVRKGVVISVDGDKAISNNEGSWVTSPAAPHPKPGWTWDGTVFSAPVFTRITAEAFWQRFTNDELVLYDVAMQHNSADNTNAKKAAAKLRIFQRDTDQSGYRRLSKNTVQALVTGLEPAVLAVGRATVILNTPITADEAFVK